MPDGRTSRATQRGQRTSGPGQPESGRPVAVVVLAAGAGTRMRSAVPKMLHRLAGRSLVEHVLRACAGLDPEHLVVVVGHERDAVETEVQDVAKALGSPVEIAVQDDQRGTGHAVACALPVLPRELAGTVLVCSGDVPLLDTAALAGLLTEHAAAANAVTVLTSVPADPAGYGRIVRRPDGTVGGVVEHRDATPEQLAIAEVNAGMYAFDAAVLAAVLGRLSAHNAQGELYLTDAVGLAVAAGHRAGAARCADPWLLEGVNDRAQLAAVGAELNRRLVHAAMLAGVTVIDPATTWLDCGVRLGRDVVLRPGVQLHGACTVGDGAQIGPDCTLTDVTVGASATVVRTHGSASTIGAGASVGPFAYLRPGTRLGAAGKIGTFVETKNSEIGAGSKVPHLTYVGDATIGEHSNIGASSVFVNYDGVAKHRAVVGSHVRTGSDTMFIAPVTVGDGAYTAAGTVLRRDVPPGALAVSGGPQRNHEGWVARRRPGTAADRAARRALGQQDPADQRPVTDGTGSGDPGTGGVTDKGKQ